MDIRRREKIRKALLRFFVPILSARFVFSSVCASCNESLSSNGNEIVFEGLNGREKGVVAAHLPPAPFLTGPTFNSSRLIKCV